jgi:hypothetical protein
LIGMLLMCLLMIWGHMIVLPHVARPKVGPVHCLLAGFFPHSINKVHQYLAVCLSACLPNMST